MYLVKYGAYWNFSEKAAQKTVISFRIFLFFHYFCF